MSSGDDPSVDWGKIAAEWASQKKSQGTTTGALPPPTPTTSFPPQMPFLMPGMQQPFPGGMFPPAFGHFNPMMIPPGAPGMNGFYPHQDHFRPPVFFPPAPFAAAESDGKGRGSSQLPRWLADAVKDKEDGSSKTSDAAADGSSTEVDDLATSSGFLLTPPSSPKEASDSTVTITEGDATSRLVKKRMTDILLKVTEHSIRDIAIDTLNQCAMEIKCGPPTVMRVHNGSHIISQPPMPLILSPGTSLSTPPIPGHSPLSIQLGPGAPTLTAPPVKAVPKAPAPTDDDTGDELLDTRVDGDNEGLPFINPEEPTKGLFRPPPDCVTLPSNSIEHQEEETKEISGNSKLGSVIKCVCYSKTGKVLAETYLNGRTHIIIGSSPRQAHIIDSHTSIYSQHIAITVCRKPTSNNKSVIQCCLYLVPCGGSTKLIQPEDVPFLQEPVIEVPLDVDDGNDDEANQAEEPKKKKEVPKKTPVADILNDGDKKREIPAGTQVFLQVGSSSRYYLIDCTQWTQSYLVTATAEWITPERVDEFVEETKPIDDEKRKRRSEERSTSRRTKRYRSHSSQSESSHDHRRHRSSYHHRHRSRRDRSMDSSETKRRRRS